MLTWRSRDSLPRIFAWHRRSSPGTSARSTTPKDSEGHTVRHCTSLLWGWRENGSPAAQNASPASWYCQCGRREKTLFDSRYDAKKPGELILLRPLSRNNARLVYRRPKENPDVYMGVARIFTAKVHYYLGVILTYGILKRTGPRNV